MKRYVYPQLVVKRVHDWGFFRIGGPGLANCLIIAAQAYLKAKDCGIEMLRPTWERIGVGQWLRHERDKRFYYGLFKKESIAMTLRRLFLLRFCCSKEICVSGLGNFFEDILDRQSEVREWFFNSIEPEAIKKIPNDLHKCIAIHIRLGDFPESLRVPLSWYRDIMRQISSIVDGKVDYLVFSDGNEDELHEILTLEGVRRADFGNALADIVAISRCGMLVAGKNSTFSAWSAYIGNVPSIFAGLEFGRVVPDRDLEINLRDGSGVSEPFLRRMTKRLK